MLKEKEGAYARKNGRPGRARAPVFASAPEKAHGKKPPAVSVSGRRAAPGLPGKDQVSFR